MVASYRSYRQKWAAQPAAPPKIAILCDTKGATLYASWNGATTYTGWTIFAGNSSEDLTAVGTVPKSGFEIEFALTGEEKSVKAGAIAEGTVLGNSTVAAITC